jgi:hypothetical protein
MAVTAEVLEDAIGALSTGPIPSHPFTHAPGPTFPRREQTLLVALALLPRKASERLRELQSLITISFPVGTNHALGVVLYPLLRAFTLGTAGRAQNVAVITNSGTGLLLGLWTRHLQTASRSCGDREFPSKPLVVATRGQLSP